MFRGNQLEDARGAPEGRGGSGAALRRAAGQCQAGSGGQGAGQEPSKGAAAGSYQSRLAPSPPHRSLLRRIRYLPLPSQVAARLPGRCSFWMTRLADPGVFSYRHGACHYRPEPGVASRFAHDRRHGSARLNDDPPGGLRRPLPPVIGAGRWPRGVEMRVMSSSRWPWRGHRRTARERGVGRAIGP